MNIHGILIVAVVAIVTIALRFLPFFIFGGKRKTPEAILYLGKVLPYAIMGMLVIYCLRSITTAGMEAAMVLPLYHEEGKGFEVKRDFEQPYIDLYLEEHGEFL